MQTIRSDRRAPHRARHVSVLLAAASALAGTACMAAVPEAGNGLRAPAPDSHLGGGAPWVGGGLKARQVHLLLLGSSDGGGVTTYRWSTMPRLGRAPNVGAPGHGELTDLLDLARGARLGFTRLGGAFMACSAVSFSSIALRP